jgi:anti-sigma B factor antagonist
MDTPQFRVEAVGDVTVAHVGGTAGEPLPAGVGLAGLVDGGARKLVVDTGAMSVVRSWFLGTLIDLQRKSRASGCQLRISCPDRDLREVFHITRLDQLLPVFPSVETALAGF